MLIEESVLINADLKKIWKTFTDVSGWAAWNTVATNASSDSGRLEEYDKFTFTLRGFSVPVKLEPKVEEVVPREKVVWSGSLLGIRSEHEFLFQQAANGVLVTSRETFRGMALLVGGFAFPEKKIRELTARMLTDLKKAAEETI